MPGRMAAAQRRMAAAYRPQRRGATVARREDAEAALARAITSLAIQVAEMSLGSGATTTRSMGLVRKVFAAYDLPTYVDVTYTRILLSYQPSAASDPITLMRSVPAIGTDYDRLSRIEALVNRISDPPADNPGARAGMPLEDAAAALQQIADERRVYRSWVMLAGAGIIGAAVAALLGGGVPDVLAATLATLLCELVRSRVARRGIPAFFAQASGAAMTTFVGVLAMVLRPVLPAWMGGISPSLVVAAGMVSLLAGIGVVSAAGDALDGNYISATARAVEVLVLTGGIVLGLVVALWLGLRMGVPAYIAPSGDLITNSTVQVVSAGLVALGYGILCNMGPRSLVAAVLLGLVLWVVYLGTLPLVSSSIARTGVAALVIGLLARLLTRPLAIPLIAMVNSGVAPLMPGLTLYRGVYAMTAVSNGSAVADRELLLCLLTGLALAAGSSLGNMLGGVFLRLRRQARRRARAEAVGTASGPDSAQTASPAPQLEVGDAEQGELARHLGSEVPAGV